MLIVLDRLKRPAACEEVEKWLLALAGNGRSRATCRSSRVSLPAASRRAE